MKFISILAAACSAVVAMPGNPEPVTLDRRQVTQPWAGATKRGRGWNYVTGTITAPNVSGQDPNRAVAIWVGIDGWSCQNAIWQTGLTFYGNGFIDNWFEWWPLAPKRYSQQFKVSPGDQIRMTVWASSPTSGNSTLENLTTGQSTYRELSNMQYRLCMADADWIYEDFGQVELANFGAVDFLNTKVSGPGGSTNADGSTITNIVADGRRRTSCGADANGVECSYLN